ncbi:MAG: SDR family NAD(P)-dependent oxidoreductase [Lachnospiraceae bacterium]|nr:SDR family NAD(P)-dependent oxidoreductase [Lachnospiraceae bacterium]
MMYVLITGTDHGLGLALVKDLLERGFFVVACRLNPEEKQVDALLEAYGERLKIVELDIGKDASVACMKEKVAGLVPHIDLLINSAGILGDMSRVLGDELDYDEILQVINVNALGALRVTNALVEQVMRSELKTILNISSEAGSIGDCWREGWFGYCMSKAAANMQSVLAYNNIRKDGGRLIVMHPGHMATYMRGHLDTTAKMTPEEASKIILHTVLDTELPVEEKPLYINLYGERLPW